MPSNDQDKRTRIRIILEIVISTLLILLALTCSDWSKKRLEKILVDKVKLVPESEAYENWLNPPITTKRTYHLFNITNPRDVALNPNDETLIVNDFLSYSYSVVTKKTDVIWSNDNQQIDYSVERLITRHPTDFRAESVNETGVFLNLLRAIFRTQFGAKPSDAFYVLGKHSPFYSWNAVEQLEGFTSDLFNTIRDKMIGPNTDKSGFVYRQNGSRLYNISIQTNPDKKGQTLSFASELIEHRIKSSDEYPFPIYDGLTYPPMLFNKPVLNIFNADFCKPFVVYFHKEVSRSGVKLYEYKLKLTDFENCTDPTDTGTCEEVDQLDVSKCISSSLPSNTIFLSKAHFHGTDKDKIKQTNVQGFQPDDTKHDSSVYFDPYTGTPFEAVFRLQLNVNVTIDPMKQSDETADGLEPQKRRSVKRLVPVFWIDQEINLSEAMRTKLLVPLLFIHHPRAFLVTAAIIISTIIIVTVELVARRSKKTIRYTRGTSL